MSKSEFTDWKSQPITQKVFKALKEREELVKDILASSAGEDSRVDRFHVGYIAALKDFYLMDFSEDAE